MPHSRERAYERYFFSADAEIADGTGAEIRTRVTNISYGGCRLLSERQLPIGTPLVVKIHRETEKFEAAAKVVHSEAEHLGLMFGDIPTPSLFVLRKWIEVAKESKPDEV